MIVDVFCFVSGASGLSADQTVTHIDLELLESQPTMQLSKETTTVILQYCRADQKAVSAYFTSTVSR